MRGVFANPARNSATHPDVIALHRGAQGYAASMRMVVTLLCSVLLIVTLLGFAHPERVSQAAASDALHAVLLIPDSLCSESSGHGTCHLVVADQPQVVSLLAGARPPHFQITPVVADSHSFAPGTPPPRHIL